MDRIIINIHSMVDLITNSSTELFCYVKDKTKTQVEEIIKSVVDEFGCEAVDIYVEEDPWIWDEKKNKEYQAKDKVEIGWCYETHQPPCSMMIKRLKEVFGDENDYNY